jgi:hypothetical protein
MVSLKEALAAQAPKRGGPSCYLCQAMRDMPKDDRQALEEALSDHRFAATMVSRALTDSGYHVTVGSVRRHRRGECAAQDVG